MKITPSYPGHLPIPQPLQRMSDSAEAGYPASETEKLTPQERLAKLISERRIESEDNLPPPVSFDRTLGNHLDLRV